MCLVRHDDRVYEAMAFPRSTFYTSAQLSKLHIQFLHPPDDRLYRRLRSARPEDLPSNTFKMLEEVSLQCNPCQRIQRAPTCFQVSLGSENCQFNERIMIDIMYLDNKSVLHIVDEGAKLSAAQLLSEVFTRNIWKTFVSFWVNIYTVLPYKIVVDDGTTFGRMFKTVGALLYV